MQELSLNKVKAAGSGTVSVHGIAELLQRLDRQERQDRKKGVLAAVLFGSILFFMLLFWIAKAGYTLPIEPQTWKTVGLLAGGGNAGASHESSSAQEGMQSGGTTGGPQQQEPSHKMQSTVAGGLTQVEDSDIHQSSEGDTSKASKRILTEPKTEKGKDQGGGNQYGNRGHEYHVGGEGRPQRVHSDYIWGPGIGEEGRSALQTEIEGYDVQIEEKIHFEITIDPAGDVVFVQAKYAIHPELAEIGKRNIMKWKFSESDPSSGNLKTSVAIYFRLK